MKPAPSRPTRLLAICALGLALTPALAAQRRPTSSAVNASLLIKTAPGAVVWVDSLRYGTAPASGELRVQGLRPGARTVRVRLKGKREVTQSVLLPAAGRTVEILPTAAADAAEARFQAAEELRERGDQAAAVKEYRQAIKLRGERYPAARLGLARSLLASEQYEEAADEARRAAREQSGPAPEAHTVIANTRRTQGLYDEALAGYRTALAQARDFSPEAHTGLAITYEELARPADAIKHFRLAATQSNGTEPVIYFLLGSLLEREQRPQEAVEAYEHYLRLEPQGKNASAVRSLLKQLRRETQ